jgi:L-lactate dehydrogenase
MGLGGFGRAEPAEGWGASVFVQLLDPEAFAGGDAFRRQTDWLVEACRSAAPRPGIERVRLPGEAALARRRQALAEGVDLYPGILKRLQARADATPAGG